MNRLVLISEQVSRWRLATIIRQTLRVLFPIMLLGSFAEVLKFTFLTPSGYMARLFAIPDWLPASRELAIMMGVIYHCTIDMIALYGAFAVTHFTVKVYRGTHATAGPIGLLAFLIISFRSSTTGNFSFSEALMAQGLLVAILVGYVVGRIIVRFAQWQKPEPYSLIRPLLIIMGLAALINLATYLVVGKLALPTYVASFVTEHTATSSLWYVIALGTLTDLLAWLAIGGPFINAPTFTDAPSWANMNAALRAGSSWNVPYQFTDTTLFHSFANFGGSGVTLALIIAMLIFSKHQNYRTVSKWSIFPAIFNSHYSMMLGIPVLFNPLFVVPFILAPVVNMLIAASFIMLKWIPVAAYPVPGGTPGPLIAFIGTNGNWVSLLLGAVLIGLDVLIYLPFVRIADQVNEPKAVVA